MASVFCVQLLSEAAKAPTRGSPLSAGWDLYASESGVVEARSWRLVGTDIAVTTPEGTYGRIAPRSGLALKKGIDVGAGVVDRDYRGEVGVILFNHNEEPFFVNQGDRIAQLILTRYDDAEMTFVSQLPNVASTRGEAGFGSTGN